MWDAAFLAFHVMGAVVSAAQIPGKDLQSIKSSSEINTKKPSDEGKNGNGTEELTPGKHTDAAEFMGTSPSLVK